MGMNVAGRPLVIGDTIATPTADGKVQLKNKNGQTQTVEMAEFKEFLIANAPKANQGDTVAFNGEKGMAPLPEDKDPTKQDAKGANTLLKLAGLAVATGVAIWQRKNIGKFVKNLFQSGTGEKASPTVEAAVVKAEAVATKVEHKVVHYATGKAPTNAQERRVMTSIETKHANNKSRKLVEEHMADTVSPKQQAIYNRQVAYKAPTAQQAKDIAKNNSIAQAETAKAHQIQNNIDTKSTLALEKAKASIRKPVAETGTIGGKLANGKDYLLEVKDGKVISMINGEGAFVDDQVKIAKFLAKWRINPGETQKMTKALNVAV